MYQKMIVKCKPYFIIIIKRSKKLEITKKGTFEKMLEGNYPLK